MLLTTAMMANKNRFQYPKPMLLTTAMMAKTVALKPG